MAAWLPAPSTVLSAQGEGLRPAQGEGHHPSHFRKQSKPAEELKQHPLDFKTIPGNKTVPQLAFSTSGTDVPSLPQRIQESKIIRARPDQVPGWRAAVLTGIPINAPNKATPVLTWLCQPSSSTGTGPPAVLTPTGEY